MKRKNLRNHNVQDESSPLIFGINKHTYIHKYIYIYILHAPQAQRGVCCPKNGSSACFFRDPPSLLKLLGGPRGSGFGFSFCCFEVFLNSFEKGSKRNMMSSWGKLGPSWANLAGLGGPTSGQGAPSWLQVGPRWVQNLIFQRFFVSFICC